MDSVGRTCTFVCINQTNGSLVHLHIGDSGYLLLRKQDEDYKIVYQSQDMLHSFNFPFQVGENGDDPYVADVLAHEAMVGDVLVLGTDGLWDNVEPEFVRQAISNATQHNGRIHNLTNVAWTLAHEAQRVAKSQ